MSQSQLGSTISSSFLAVEPPPDKLNFVLLPGETLITWQRNATHICPFDGPINGTFFVTNYKFVFENGESAETKYGKKTTNWKGHDLFNASPIPGPEVPLGMIVKIDKIGGQNSRKENAYGLDITCNDFRTLRFGFQPEPSGKKSVYEHLTNLAFPVSNGAEFFAFSYSEKFGTDGWEVFNQVEELNRIVGSNQLWRICTTANAKYELCNSYPKAFAIPSKIDDAMLENAAKFRTKNRLPVLSWLHPQSKVSITRCSQPKVGPWRRNEQDEELIKAIRSSGSLGANKGEKFSPELFIVDARPKVNAVGNQAKGAGYENTEVYEQTEILFMNIPNIHVIRESHRKLRDCCFPKIEEGGNWYSKVEDSRWLEYIKLLLQTTNTIVDLVDKQGSSVLLHCSDGWDRTPQLTSLAMLLLDPFYRTVRGFCILITKEWFAYGHKFAQRLGLGNKDFNDEQRAPIFIQFLDCVFQYLNQFPTAFEFNQQLLVTIADEAYTCRFGNFLFNSEQEAEEAKVREKTQSLWSFVLSNVKDFTNPLYIKRDQVLVPIVNSRKLVVWKEYCYRWNPELKKNDVAVARQWELRLLVEDLQNKIADLEKKLDK